MQPAAVEMAHPEVTCIAAIYGAGENDSSAILLATVKK